MGKWTFIIAIAGALLSCNNVQESHIVEEKKLNEAVYASGEIWPEEYDFLETSSPERVLEIKIKEDDTVGPGDLLAILGNPSEQTQLNILSQQVKLAQKNTEDSEAQLSELKGKIELAKIQYQQDSTNAQRYSDLAKDNAVSKKEAEQARLQAKASRTNYENMKLRYQTLKTELQNQLMNTKKELARLNQSLEGKLLSSKLKGKVYSINVEEGEIVNPGESVMFIGSNNQFKLDLLVDERDIGKIKIGQKVWFETDAFSNQQFEAEISKIVPVLQKENRSFKVEAKVLDKQEFYPQSSVEANIIIRKNKNAIMIPYEYLLNGDSVFVEKNGEQQKIKIQTGARDGDYVEIINGLASGNVIYKKN